MTKSKNASHRSAKQSSNPINTRSTAKPTGNSEKNQNGNLTATAAKKGKKAIPAAKSTPPHDVVDEVADETMVQAFTHEHRLSVNTNSTNQAIILCPVSVRLADLFLKIDDTSKSDIQGHEFKDRAFESKDDKEVEKLLKTGAMLLDNSNPGDLRSGVSSSRKSLESTKKTSNTTQTEQKCETFVLTSQQAIPSPFLRPRKWTWKATSTSVLSHLRGSRLP